MDKFNLKKYLAEGRLLKEGEIEERLMNFMNHQVTKEI